MATNEMEVVLHLSTLIHEAGKGLSPEKILTDTKTHFGSKTFGDAELRHLYNFALMVPKTLVRNVAELHFSLVPAAKLRCPTKVFHQIASIDHGEHPYTKVATLSRRVLSGSMGRRAASPTTGSCATGVWIHAHAHARWILKRSCPMDIRTYVCFGSSTDTASAGFWQRSGPLGPNLVDLKTPKTNTPK